MLYYHITLQSHLQDILFSGLKPSKSGLDGPGLYLWKGPLDAAVKEADLSLYDNHDELSDAEYKAFTKALIMLSVKLPDNASFTVEWPEYVVYPNSVAPSCISPLGSFHDLLFTEPPKASLDKLIESANAQTGISHTTDLTTIRKSTPERST